MNRILAEDGGVEMAAHALREAITATRPTWQKLKYKIIAIGTREIVDKDGS